MSERLHLQAMLFSHLLGLFGTPAYVTDRLNRVRAVNQAFARLVGDPLHDGLRGEDLLVHSLIIGPYREHFPRRYEEVTSCTPLLMNEIAAGKLQPELRPMLRRALLQDPDLARRVEDTLTGYRSQDWDGDVVMRPGEGRAQAFTETVVPLAEISGDQMGPRYLNLWTVDGRRPHSQRADMLLALTPREREVAVLFAKGLNATEIAEALDLSVHTVRDYRDSIYDKLSIHSRAELGRLIDPTLS